jgi:type VI secretion system protein ImpA
MSDLEFAVEPLLVPERLLQVIPGPCPSGSLLRNTPTYDQLRESLRLKDAGPGGVWQRDVKPTDYRGLIKTASDLLSRESKDLDIAVWLTEALTREHGLPGLVQGILLIQQMLEIFWETVYPSIDSDGDEGFRAKPINRLNTAFVGVLPQLSVTFDGRRLHQYNASSEVPTVSQAENNSELRKNRERALVEGVIAPEEINRSIEATSAQFYEELSLEVRQVKDAVQSLQATCDRKFRTSDRPFLEKLAGQVEKLGLTVQVLQRAKGVT